MNSNTTRYNKTLVGLGILLLIFILRLPSFWTPILDVDESQFAGYANALLLGGLPFIGSVDTKPLGIYYFFAAIFYIFGKNNMLAVHIATTIVVALTALYCYFIAKKLFSYRAGIIAALFYSIFTTTYIPKFISTSIVVIMMLPITMSIYYILSSDDIKRLRILLAGALLGIACCFKYQAGITLCSIGIYYILLPLIFKHTISYKKRVLDFLVYISGMALVGAIFILHLFYLGVLDDFYFWSFQGSLAYITAGNNFTDFPYNILIRGSSFILSTFLIWYLGISYSLKLIFKLFKTDKQAMPVYLIFIWFILNIIPICVGGRFFGHYFIQILPPLVILAAARSEMFFDWLNSSKISLKHKIAYSLFILSLTLPAAGFFGARLLDDTIYKFVKEENPADYKPIAEYIKNNSDPSDKIFVWGFATPIYFYSDRDSASRFLWCDWLTGRIAGSPTAQDPIFETSAFITPSSWEKFFEDLETNKPIFFIDTSPGNYHDYGKYPVSKYSALKKYLLENYTLVKEDFGASFYKRNDQSNMIKGD